MVDQKERHQGPGKFMSTLGYAGVFNAIGAGIGMIAGRTGSIIGGIVGFIAGGVMGYNRDRDGQDQFEEIKQENRLLKNQLQTVSMVSAMNTPDKVAVGKHTERELSKSQNGERTRS